MVELKTLKDIEHKSRIDYYLYKKITKSEGKPMKVTINGKETYPNCVSPNDLRQAAREWVKEIEDEPFDKEYFKNSKYKSEDLKNTQEWIKIGTLSWIKHFFNLEDKDAE